ncbi:MAG: anti-sigma factor [Gammaproteobacteria bacterium]
MSNAPSDEERLQELVIQRALEGIGMDEARELTLLAQAHPDVDIPGLEKAIAALDAIPFGTAPALPETVEQNVMARFPKAAPAPSVADTSAAKPSAVPWLALAASLVVAALGWYRAMSPVSAPIPGAPVPVAELPDAGRWDFNATEDPAGQAIEGEMRWSTSGQRGEMHLSGLPTNDPAQQQYQLWIFDASRSDAHPVDGGVFDIRSDANQVVAFSPTLSVRKPTLFAITIEPPGGVMVSSRERLVALAKVP